MSADDPAVASESRYASRKFLIACGTIIAGHVALYSGAIDAAQWLDLMKWAAGLYFAGNVAALAADSLARKP